MDSPATSINDDPSTIAPAASGILYQAQLTISLASVTLDEFDDKMRESFRNIIVVVANEPTMALEDVQIKSIEENTVESSENGTSTSLNNIGVRLLQGEVPDPPTTVIDVTFKLGETESCSQVEQWAKMIRVDDEMLDLLRNNGVLASDVFEKEPYTVMAYDSAGILASVPASSCVDLEVVIDINGGTSGTGSKSIGASARTGIIVSAVLVGVGICVACIIFYALRSKRFGKTYLAHRSTHTHSEKDKDNLMEIGSVDHAADTSKDREWSIIDLTTAPSHSVLTLETTFCNAHAKECLRWFMLERQMEEAYLFYEKMTDQVLRPCPNGSHQAGMFKQSVIDEYIRVGSLHQLNISESLRRRTVKDSSTDLASLVPVIKEVHKLILSGIWLEWVTSSVFQRMMLSDEMQLAGFTYVADTQSQLKKAAGTHTGDFVHTQCEDYDGIRIGKAPSWQGQLLECPLWGNIFFADDDSVQNLPTP